MTEQQAKCGDNCSRASDHAGDRSKRFASTSLGIVNLDRRFRVRIEEGVNP
jgi:hypothetical protein